MLVNFNTYPVQTQFNNSFRGGKNPKIAENQLKVLLSQDIWSDKLKVKMPETVEEKKVLIDILTNRLKLDRFVNLSNEKLRLYGEVSYVNNLIETNPSHPDLPKLKAELQKKGNLESMFEDLDKDIELEKKNNLSAYNYLKEIDNMSDEYIDKKLLSIGKLQKYWDKIVKYNINPEGKLSVKELLEKVSNQEIKEVSTSAPKQPLTKKQLLRSIQIQYEQTLRRIINIYQDNTNHCADAKQAREITLQYYNDAIKKFPGIEKQISKIFDSVEKKFVYKTDRLITVSRIINGETVVGVDIHPLGKVWEYMDESVNEAKKAKKEIADLKVKIVEHPKNMTLKAELDEKKEVLEQAKKDWLELLEYSVKYEEENRRLFDEADRLSEYEFLADENPTIKKHKELYAMCQKNNNSMPERVWNEILN